MRDILLAKVSVIKRKKGVPTVIEVEGQTYILRHENHYQVGGSREKKRQSHNTK